METLNKNLAVADPAEGKDRTDEIFRRFFRPPPPGKQVWVPASPGRLGILCCGGEPEATVSLPNELAETKKAA